MWRAVTSEQFARRRQISPREGQRLQRGAIRGAFCSLIAPMFSPLIA